MRHKYLTLMLLPLVLTGCNKTKELYPGNAYDTGNFETNYYLEHNNVDKLVTSEPVNYDASEKFYISNPSYGQPLEGLRFGDQLSDKDEFLEWNIDTPIEDRGSGYGPTKNLTTINDSFAYGVLSRLYDGRVRCDGYYAKSRLQINKTGFSTFFPKELIDAKYLAIALRGDVNAKAFSNNIANVDITVSLYKHNTNSDINSKYNINYINVPVPTNTGGITSLLVLYFDTIFGSNYKEYLDGIIAMSVTFSLSSINASEEDINKYGYPVDDKDNPNGPHFALMLYEVMFPDSIWR